MKYSFMTFSCEELMFNKVLSTAKKYGYDGIEFRIASGHKHGVEFETDTDARKEIKQKVADKGLDICCIATSCEYSNPKTAKEMVEDTLKNIDLAADVGAPTIRVFGGLIKNTPRQNSFKSIVDSLAYVANHAQDKGVMVCMETHDSWCDPNHVADIMKAVDKPSIGVTWDIMHPVQRGNSTMTQSYETLKPWIKHVHFHDGIFEDEKITFLSIGQGSVDHKTAVELLQADDYQGYLSGEWMAWESHDIHLPRELALIKAFEK